MICQILLPNNLSQLMLLSSTKGPVYGLGSPFEVQAVFKSAPTFIFSLDSLSLFCICAQFPGSGCVESFGSVLSKCMYNLPVSQPSVESLLNPLYLSLCNIYLKTSGQFTVIYVPWPGQYPLVRMAAGLSSWHWVWLFHSSLQIKSVLPCRTPFWQWSYWFYTQYFPGKTLH